jgi:hypothetical protein
MSDGPEELVGGEMAGASCGECRDSLPELALGVLTGEDRSRTLAHIEWCDPCQAALEELVSVSDLLLELAPRADPPVGFEVRVADRVARLANETLSTPVDSDAPVIASQSARDPLGGSLARSVDESHSAALVAHATAPSLITPSTAKQGRRGLQHGGTRPRGRRRSLEVGGDALGPHTWLTGSVLGRLAAVLLLVIVLGGLGALLITHPWSTAKPPVTATAVVDVPLMSGNSQVGEVTLLGSLPVNLSIAVRGLPGEQRLRCAIKLRSGQTVVLGSFAVSSGRAAWGAPISATRSALAAVELFSPTGVMVARANA